MTLAEMVEQAKEQGYSSDQIKQVIQETPTYQQALNSKFTPSDIWATLGLNTTGEEAGRLATIGGSALVHGAAMAAGIPGSIEAAADKYLPAPVSEGLHALDSFGALGALHGMSHLLGFGGDLPTMGDVSNVVDKAGFAGPNPATSAEEWTNALATGAGSAVPIVLSGGAAAPAIGLGLSSATGAEFGHRLMPESTLAPIVGGLAGGLGAEGGFGVAGKAAASRLLRMTEGEAEAKSAALDTFKAAHANAKDFLAELQSQKRDMLSEHQAAYDEARAQHFTNQTDAEAGAEDLIAKTTGDAQKVLDTTAESIHPAATLQEGGTSVQQSATHWLGGLDDKVGALLNPLYDQLPSTTPVELTNFKSALSDINSSAGGLEALNSDLKPRLPAVWQKKLAALEALRGTAGEEAVPPPTVADLKTLRSSLGHALADPKVINDVGAQNANHLYAALSADLREPFAAAGLGEAWDSANAQAKGLYDFARDTAGQAVKSATGKGNADPEAVASSLLAAGKKGGSTLASLRSQMPDAADALASTAIKTGAWSSLSPEAKAALVPDAASRAAVDAANASQAGAKSAAYAARDSQIAQSATALRDLRFAQRAEARGLSDKIAEAQEKARLTGKALEAASGERDATLATLKGMKEGSSGKSATLSYLNSLPLVSRLATGPALGIVGSTVMHSLGLPEISLPLSIALGELAPLGLSAAERIATNPKLLASPTYGGAVGNQLAIGQSPQ